VFVIGGSLDRVRPPALAEAMANAIPGARNIEVFTGRYMAVQSPDQSNIWSTAALRPTATGQTDTDAMRLHRKSRPPAVAACFASGIVIFLLFSSPTIHIDLL
jgi:hypothetical protein